MADWGQAGLNNCRKPPASHFQSGRYRGLCVRIRKFHLVTEHEKSFVSRQRSGSRGSSVWFMLRRGFWVLGMHPWFPQSLNSKFEVENIARGLPAPPGPSNAVLLDIL